MVGGHAAGSAHGGLLVRALERSEAAEGMALARLSFDLWRPVTRERITPSVTVLRDGRKARTVEASLAQGGKPVARCTAVFLKADAAATPIMVVIALVADPSVHNAIELARFAANTGADVIKLGLPYPYTPSEAAMLDVFGRIDDAADMPFVVESSDALAVPLDVIAALTERPNFIGVEEWGSDVGRMDRLFQDFSDRLAILSSGEATLLFLSLLGAPGLIAAEVNFAPRLMREFLEACGRREFDRALALFGRRRRYRDPFRDGLRRGLPVFTPYAKAAVALQGLPVGTTRPPHDPLTTAEIARVRDVLRRELDVVATC